MPVAATQLDGLTVMIVDDEVFARSFLVRILERLGVTVVREAEDGEAAVELLREHGTGIGAVICDIEMPKLNGFEFVRRVRMGEVPGCERMPIIMLTGRDTERNMRSARIHRIDGFIVKPPNLRAVEACLRKALQG